MLSASYTCMVVVEDWHVCYTAKRQMHLYIAALWRLITHIPVTQHLEGMNLNTLILSLMTIKQYGQA